MVVFVWHLAPRFPSRGAFLVRRGRSKNNALAPTPVFFCGANWHSAAMSTMGFPTGTAAGDVHVYTDDAGRKINFQWDGITWNRMDDPLRPAVRTGPKGPRTTTSVGGGGSSIQSKTQPAAPPPEVTTPVVDSAPETDQPGATTSD
jgi:hypothetical protein